MLREATRALAPRGDGQRSRSIRSISDASQLLHGLDEPQLPPLSGYAYAKPAARRRRAAARRPARAPRSAARRLAVRPRPRRRLHRQPARRRRGVGRLAGVHQVLVAARRTGRAREHSDDEVAIDAHRDAGVTELAVRTFGPTADAATLIARLRVDDDRPARGRRSSRASRACFTASLLDIAARALPADPHQAHRRRRRHPAHPAGHRPGHRRDRRGRVPPQRARPRPARPPDQRHRRHAQRPPDTLVERQPGTAAPATRSHWLVPLAMLLFLADTAVRLKRR